MYNKENSGGNSGTVIIMPHNCKPHPFQDQRYGDGRRVANKSDDGARCTVCGVEILPAVQ